MEPDAIEHSRVPVAEDKRGVIAGEIEQIVAIDVDQPAAVAFSQDDRIRRVEEGTARVPTGKVLAAFQKVFAGSRGQAAIDSFLRGACSYALESSSPKEPLIETAR